MQDTFPVGDDVLMMKGRTASAQTDNLSDAVKAIYEP